MMIHQELVKKALPYIKSYQNDLLVHDKNAIDQYPGRKFLHFTGDTGTTIITLYWSEDYPGKDQRVPYLFSAADRYHILKGISDIIKALPGCNRMDLILYFDGKTLKPITYDRAKQIICEYTTIMQNQFAK